MRTEGASLTGGRCNAAFDARIPLAIPHRIRTGGLARVVTEVVLLEAAKHHVFESRSIRTLVQSPDRHNADQAKGGE
jgi:hypothetical protein